MFTGVADLIAAASTGAGDCNDNVAPSIWNVSADDIIEKVRGGRAARPLGQNADTALDGRLVVIVLNYGAQPDMVGSLTAAQRSIWAAQQLRPEVPYNFAGFLAIDHDVDAERLLVACESAATRFGTPCVRLCPGRW